MTQQTFAPILENIHSAAAKLGLTESALRMMIFRHGLPVTKIGGRIYLEMPIVTEWIASHRGSPTKGPGVAGRMRKIY